MKAYKLAEKLLAGEDAEVMFQDPNSHGGPFCVQCLELRVVREDEFPEEFNMSKGFRYIELTN